jgi:hypothetical protein
MRAEPKRIQFAGAPKWKPPILASNPEVKDEDQSPGSASAQPTPSAGSTEPTAKSGSAPIEKFACSGCRALTIKMRAMEKRLAILEMVKIRATTIAGQEYQLRANIADHVVTIKNAIQKILNVEEVHLYHKDVWLDPNLTLGSFYTNRDIDVTIVVTKGNSSSSEKPPTFVDPHLAWQPYRGDQTHWFGMENPVILDRDPQTLPQTQDLDPWFYVSPQDP